MSEPILFRAHHFMCTLGFQGMGYSPYFVRNFQEIVDKLKQNPLQEIEVVATLDSICSACPHQTREKYCTKQDMIESLDKAHAEVLSLSPGQRLTWQAAKIQIKTHMTYARFDAACQGCEWKKAGVCEKALTNLLNE